MSGHGLGATMIRAVAATAVALVTAARPIGVKADADAFPWKLLRGTPQGTWYIAHEYATSRRVAQTARTRPAN